MPLTDRLIAAGIDAATAARLVPTYDGTRLLQRRRLWFAPGGGIVSLAPVPTHRPLPTDRPGTMSPNPDVRALFAAGFRPRN